MSEFKPIETQEQLDAIIKERIGRAQKSVEERFAGFLSPEDVTKKTDELSKRIGDLEKALGDEKTKGEASIKELDGLRAKVKGYEVAAAKSSIAAALGLPHELAERINGESKEDMEKDAKALLEIFGRQTPPLHDPEPRTKDSKDEAYKKMVADIFGEK